LQIKTTISSPSASPPVMIRQLGVSEPVLQQYLTQGDNEFTQLPAMAATSQPPCLSFSINFAPVECHFIRPAATCFGRFRGIHSGRSSAQTVYVHVMLSALPAVIPNMPTLHYTEYPTSSIVWYPSEYEGIAHESNRRRVYCITSEHSWNTTIPTNVSSINIMTMAVVGDITETTSRTEKIEPLRAYR